MPTLLAAAGVEPPSTGLDGEDLALIASGKASRPFVYSQFQRGGQAIYTIVGERWKYAYSAPDDQEFLFDREQDPQESRSLAGVRFCEPARGEMQRELIAYLRSVGETEGLEGDRWRVFPRHEMPRNPDAGLLVQDQAWAKTDIPGYTDA
jgi:arylsulfatase A-like enzyme